MTFKRAAIAAVAALSITTAAGAEPVDGQMEQAIHDTLLQALMRGGYQANSEAVQKTLQAVQNTILVAATAGGGCGTLGCTWNQVIKGLPDWLAVPFRAGKDGEKFQPGAWSGGNGGDYGGAGASCGDNCFPDKVFAKGRDCGDIEYRLDAQGNFVIPSFALDIGNPAVLGAAAGSGTAFYRSTLSISGATQSATATTSGAVARRLTHLLNMTRQPIAWYGVVGPTTTSGCWNIATIAYRNTSGSVVNRQSSNICTTGPYTHDPSSEVEAGIGGGMHPHVACPQENVTGGDFHFYGASPSFNHWHECTWYYPNFELSPDGYAINTHTSIPYASFQSWPKGLPGFIQQCSIDPAAVAKIAEALWKKAAATPGYDGAPPKAVSTTDARPGPAKVEDLGDDPGDTPQPTPDPNAPAPTTPDTPGGSTGSTDVCDFGPGGCDDPGTATPEIDDPPTDFMTPIFDWLPDLPSLEFNTASAQCPTWDVNLTAYLGSTAQYTLDSHCPLVEQNSAALGALMLAIWGVMAAMIILRA